MRGSSHEQFERDESLKPGSERSFGVVMAAAFVVLAGLKLWSGSATWAGVWTALALAFGILAFVAPRLLKPLNLAWLRFGLLLHKIMTPVVMGLLFFAVMMPIGLLMRLLGQRPLALGFDETATSYWSERTEPTRHPQSMRKQY
jgi:Saxitoxin biosynthesis operon protein SxtJ